MDYSPYYYKYERKRGKRTHSLPRESRNERTVNTVNAVDNVKTAPQTPIRKRAVAFILAISLLIVGFVTAFVAIEVKSGGVVYHRITGALGGAYKTYYLLVTEGYSTSAEAEIRSKYIAKSGGAGYIYLKDNQYFVVIATYTDKISAEKVRKKNVEFSVIEAKVKEDNESIDFAETIIGEIITLSETLAAGKISRSEAVTEIYGLRNRVLSEKAAMKPQDYHYIEGLYGGLDAISTNTVSTTTLVAELRWIAAVGICAICA